jgi:hypothetical protein
VGHFYLQPRPLRAMGPALRILQTPPLPLGSCLAAVGPSTTKPTNMSPTPKRLSRFRVSTSAFRPFRNQTHLNGGRRTAVVLRHLQTTYSQVPRSAQVLKQRGTGFRLSHERQFLALLPNRTNSSAMILPPSAARTIHF